MTMVLPFALVVLGCRWLFLFLLLCFASCSPYLHLAQTALSAVGWFNLGDDFAFFIWDPGMCVDVCVSHSLTNTHDGASFGLNIRNKSSCNPGLAFAPSCTTSACPCRPCRLDRHPLRPTRPTNTTPTNTPVISADRSGAVAHPFLLWPTQPMWDPGIANVDNKCAADECQLNTHHVASVGLINNTVPIAAATSLFRCSHSVLSRPTVPNIQWCCNNLLPTSSIWFVRWCLPWWSRWLCLLLSKRVATCLPFGVLCCFRLSFPCHIMMPLLCSIRQTAQQQMHRNHWSILHGVTAFTSEQTVLSHPQFPSLPTSFRVELLPIHVSFGCDTIWLVAGCWLCFSGAVRGSLSLDSSCPQSSSQCILWTICFKLSDLPFEWSSSLSCQDFFHFMCAHNTHLSFSNHCNPWRTHGKASWRSNAKGPFWISLMFIGFNAVTIALLIELFICSFVHLSVCLQFSNSCYHWLAS